MLFLLLGCNSLSTPRGIPIDISGLRSALWMTDRYISEESDYASAYVLLSSEDVRCATFRESEFTQDEGAIWQGDHVLLYVNWYYSPFDWTDYEGGTNPGWEGMYGAGISSQENVGEGLVTRRMNVHLYDDGVRTSPSTEVGVLELDYSGSISGRLDHASVESRFSAEDCGEQDAQDYDTGWYE